MSFGDIISHIFHEDTPHAQGSKFEKLVKKIVQIARDLPHTFDEVYLWSEFNSKFQLKQGDFGIDIMAKSGDEWVAIQCKAYQKDTLELEDLKNFLGCQTLQSSDGTQHFPIVQHYLFHTCKTISKNVQKALLQCQNAQSEPAIAYGFYEIGELGIDWGSCKNGDIESLRTSGKKQLRPHQREALEKIHSHFVEQGNARGKVIMACGTGKSLLAIRTIDSLVDSGEIALFLAPSLALIDQMIKEFRKESISPSYKLFAVCSDSKVGGEKGSEDLNAQELSLAPTTDPSMLAHAINAIISTGGGSNAHSLESSPKIVIFSTYQSLDVVIASQKLFNKPLKIIINDEAHRTAGVQKLDETGNVKEISVWQKTHDNDLLKAQYRLYLTATPRIFSDKAKDKLAKARKNDNASELLLFSMDDEKLFGKEIYSLRFSQAIDLGLLSDFRVIISYINEKYLADYTNKLTQAQESSSLTLENAGKMVAFTNAMKKRNVSFIDERGKQESYTDTKPMGKALAFHSRISDSTRMAGYFNGEKSVIDKDIVFTHIDGKDNASTKSHKLAWLSEAPKEEMRVLSNAKCLTEGIDVPSLDAVCFFDKRDSVVDVVQAVGRAIRKADSKKYGYIILPLVLSDEEIKSYDKTLKGDKFKIVWQTLKALRSHDERLIDEARINEVVSIAGGSGGDTPLPPTELFTLSELFNEMKNAVPKNLGDLQYWENYASKVGDIMQALILRIQALLDSSPAIQELFATFCRSLQGNLNASFDESEAIALVAQHIITKPIFECIFPSLDFATFDKVSAELEKLHTKLLEQGLNAETKTLEKFYTSVRQSAEYARSDKSKQSLIKNLYDTLFKQAFKKTQEKLGIVYTPIEGVDFIIHSTQYLLQKHFGKSLGDRHIHIADPFTGTGTFITRTIQSGYLDSNLESKFAKELWANEITLLGYYIAQINIATTYHERLLYLRDSALRDKAGSLWLAASIDAPVLSPCSPLHNPAFSSQILESQGGDTAPESTFETKILEEESQASQSSSRALKKGAAIHKSTQVDSASAESMDCHAANAARNDKTLSESANKTAQSVKTPQTAEKADSSDNAKNLSESQNAEAQKVDSRGNAESLNKPQAAGFCDDFVGCAWRGEGEGIYLSGNEQALAADSRKSAQKPTPTEIKLFDNLLFTDTFNTYAPDSKGFKGRREDPKLFDSEYLEKNYAKIQEFKNTEFKIFMSNPPYSAGQKSANDDNANEKSPHIDKRISDTYRAKSLATSTKNTSFDSFKRALRFMSDRIGESGGIIGLVVNGSFLDSNSDDGLRACLADEFDYIYIFNLRGNQRTSGETSRKEGGKFFDSGSRTPVAICFFVKLDSSMDCHALPSDKARNDRNLNEQAKDSRICDEKSGLCEATQGRALGVRNRSGDEAIADLSRKAESTSDKPTPKTATIYYYDIGDYLDRQTKLNIIQNFKSIESMESQGLFTTITPNKDYDWINQRDYSFMAFTPMGSTGQKLKPLAINAKGELELEIFELFSQGVVTGKDNWSFNFSKENLAKNIALCIDTYNTEREALAANPAHKLCNDLSKVTWSGSLDKRVRANRELVFDESRIRICSYRPFTKEFLYFDNGYNHSHCQMDKIYPFGNKGEAIACINGGFENVMMALNDRGGGDFGALRTSPLAMTKILPTIAGKTLSAMKP